MFPHSFKSHAKRARDARSAITLVALLSAAASSALAQSVWTGGGDPDFNWSVGTNWDTAPSATGSSLTFDGSVGLSNTNDFVTQVNAITFAATAGAFTLSGEALNLGTGGNAAVITANNALTYTIDNNITLTGTAGSDRQIVLNGGGTIVFNGSINYSNLWLFPTGAAGTIILNGANTGDGRGGVLNAGTNTMRAALRNNIAGTQLVLGSDTALGNSGSGSYATGDLNLRGLVANAQLNISTGGGDRDLSGSSFIINTNNITFNGADNLTIGNIINQGANRDFVVSSTGTVTVSSGIFLSENQTGRQLFINLTGAGGMVVDGVIYDTFHSGGLTAGTSTFRKAGTATLTSNGNNAFTGNTQVDNGTLVFNGSNVYTGTTTVLNTGTLLVNGTHNQGAGANAGRYTIATNATLGGNGTIILSDTDGGTTGMSVSGIVSPGGNDNIGTFTLNGTNSVRSMIALESSGRLLFDLNVGLASDVLALTGAQANDLFFNGNVINFNDLSGGSLANGIYTLITADAAGAYNGLTLDGLTIIGGLSIGTGLEAYADSTLELVGNNIVLNVVPEPPASGLVGIALAGGVLFIRRIRRLCRQG